MVVLHISMTRLAYSSIGSKKSAVQINRAPRQQKIATIRLNFNISGSVLSYVNSIQNGVLVIQIGLAKMPTMQFYGYDHPEKSETQ